METAPYYVVAAERKGFPPVQKQSLAHVMQNMWLKATALGIGFQLISATGMMSKNREFMGLMGLQVGEYELDGCLLGFSKTQAKKREVPDLTGVTRWL
jgi:nitroreductase